MPSPSRPPFPGCACLHEPATPSLGYRQVGAVRRLLHILCFFAAWDSVLGASGFRGLPFSRDYSLEAIGYVPRGSRLGFDPFGRIAVIHDGVYAVLNDTIWLNLADTVESSHVALAQVVQGSDGKTYYGGLGSWGRAEIQADGLLRTIPLTPPNPPTWTQATTFEDVLVTKDGVYFCSRNGVVFWDAARLECVFFEMPRASKTFRVGDQVFVSNFDGPLGHIDVINRSVRNISSPLLDGLDQNVVELATELSDQRALLSLVNGRLLVFDGTRATPWPGQDRNDLVGHIAILRTLADGNIAMGIAERGVFVLSPGGVLLSSLNIPQYHRVSDIASREPGVMWLINEESIEKILYDSALTGFDQRLGLPPTWPLVVSWQDRIMVATNGLLYESTSPQAGSTTRFDRLEAQPPNGAWALTSWGRHLLVGNDSGIYAFTSDRRYAPVGIVPGLTHLMMVDENTCFAIGRTQIALFAWDGTRWIEPIPRIGGVPHPAVVHRAGRSVWIELGGDGVARVSLQEGRLNLVDVRSELWTKSSWVNIGIVDDTVVLSAAHSSRRYFSETTGDWCDRPDLNRVLERAPPGLARVRKDNGGNIWVTYNESVIKLVPKGGDYEIDTLSYDLLNDRYPVVHVLPDGDVWVSASRSLYHVEETAGANTRPFPAPVLVSLMDAQRNVELLASRPQPPAEWRFSYDQNNLTFRFFSGNYAWRRTPKYEFRLNGDDPWSTLDTGSLLRFPDLHEGSYRLQVRLVGPAGGAGAALIVPFEVLPPWYRTWPAYALYVSLLLLTAFGAIRWSGQMARKRNRALEQLVGERTKQLESTMSRLNEETRVTATLAERNRLAGEIHDSVQQGLSGAILQLDTTLTLPIAAGNLRARLNVVRNMVSYARQEVQHAVWDLESPLLEGNDLGEALRRLATNVSSGSLAPQVEVSGAPIALPRGTMHHLLRIAQEATTNALRHANAREIIIRLDYQPDAVLLVITDDGAGFQPETVLNQTGHFGLRGIRTRARKLNGTLTITSAGGEGTVIRILVPLPSLLPDEHTAESHHSAPNPNSAG